MNLTTQPTRLILPAVATVVLCGLCACERPPEPGQPLTVERVLGGIGDSPGRFLYPRAMEFASNGLWVIDRSGRVQRLDTKTGFCTGLFRMPKSELGMPTGLFIGPGIGVGGEAVDELLYIADTHYHRVLVVKPPKFEDADRTRARESDIHVVREVGGFGTGDGQFTYPTDVCVLYKADQRTPERYFVSEYGGNDRVSIFDSGWKFVKAFGAFGSEGESGVRFHRPQSLAIWNEKGSARVVVTDSVHHRIGLFTTDGELVRWVGGKAPGAGMAGVKEMPSTIELPPQTSAGPVNVAEVGKPATFLYPYGVQILDDGSAMVSEFGASRVQRVDLNTGVCLGSWGRAGRGAGELAVPWEVRVHGNTAYVLDSGNNRIQTFASPVSKTTPSPEKARAGAIP